MRAGLVAAAVVALLRCDLDELPGVADAWEAELSPVEWETALGMARAGCQWDAWEALQQAAVVIYGLVRAGRDEEARAMQRWVRSRWGWADRWWS